MLKSLLYRPVWLPVSIISAALLVALMLLLANAWQSMERLQPVKAHLERITILQDTSRQLMQDLLDHLVDGKAIPAPALVNIRANIDTLLNSIDKQTEPELVALLRQARQTLDSDPPAKMRSVARSLEYLNNAVARENTVHNNLFRELKKSAEMELSVAAIMLVALPGLALIILFLVRKRILTPINSLAWLMSQLARNDTPATTASIATEIDPLLKPLANHYNAMVLRLEHLEQEHRNRQESLESQVRHAASSLLDQQRSLAKAEQLAAVGELAARLAHELRNPLAGMHMAVINLQHEVNSPEHSERLGMVARELERVTFLLNGLLDQARLRPEPLKTINIAEVVSELLALARYQLPDNIHLESLIDERLSWRLPENELRRSLLNLILNAHQAIGTRPGEIRVLAREQNRQLVFEVCDNGPGFPRELLESGVHSFVTTRVDGTGLGLASVQHFAQELHGSMQLQNLVPNGACVRLSIPTAETNSGVNHAEHHFDYRG